VATEDPSLAFLPIAAKTARFPIPPVCNGFGMPIVMVPRFVVGGLFGICDRWLHTKPVLMLITWRVGFYVGVRDVLRRVHGETDGDCRRRAI